MKRLRGVVVLTSIIVIAVTLGLHMQARADFALGSTRLSAPDQVCDIEPRSAISPDGQWLGAIWIRGDRVSEGCSSRGQAVVRWATEGDGQMGWSDPVALTPPSAKACAVHADIGLNGITLHVAVSYWQTCSSPETDSSIRYYTCNMTTGTCLDHGNAVYQAGTFDLRLSDVRLALDEQARPHVAFARGTHSLADGRILYTRLTGAAWSSPILVSTGTALEGFYRPNIAVSNGRAHFVWARHRTDTFLDPTGRPIADVQYRYCEVDSSTCYPDGDPFTYQYPTNYVLEATYAMPDIAARDDRVMLVWNVCADVKTDAPCEAFYLLYARSNDNGQTLVQPLEVGSDNPLTLLGSSLRWYAGSDEASQVSAYTSHARAVVTLNDQGLPRVAWQAEVDGGYVISTTYAITSTDTNFTWAPEADSWQIGAGDDIRILPSILLPDPPLDDTGLHVVYMNAWLEQGVSSRSQVYYDYLGTRRPNLTAESATGTHFLPAERAVPLSVLVLDANDNPISDTDVIFNTDQGSFSHAGYGLASMQSTSDHAGRAEVTLYNNLAGTAHVRAWIDSTANGWWDADEPTTVFTHTWHNNTTPALSVGTTWANVAMPGDLITATLKYHPFESPNFVEQAAPYVLWLCPEAGAASGEAKLAGPLEVDVETWTLADIVLEVPWEAEGSYYLESREDGEASPCVESDRVAKSPTFEVATTPPPGTAWLAIDKNRPAAGESFQTTLKAHAAGTYEIWWCPAAQDAAPVSEKILENVSVPAGQEPAATVSVPQGIDGIYRLESHNQGLGACGNATTREGISALIQPAARIFLPLVSKR